LRGSDAPDLALDLFGRRWSSPFAIAPMGSVGLGRFSGDLELAHAAHAKNIPFALSGSSSIPMERILPVAPHARFQAYVPGDRNGAEAIADREARRTLMTSWLMRI
jgi:L-lactate dehydrogenase (cytochrome)